MKKDIHPKYFPDAKIICACGNVIEAGSTVKEMKVEICAACHPFYTGKKKSMDTAGRVDRFKKMSEKAAIKQAAAAPKKVRVKKSETVEAVAEEKVSK